MSRVVVGVDAGASRVRIIVARDGHIAAQAEAAAVNPNVVGADASVAAILDLLRSQLHGATPDAMCVGAAGIDRDSTLATYTSAIKTAIAPRQLTIVPDALLALRAAVADGDGAVIIAGTGSIGFAVRDDHMFRCGGYGHVFGDEGSGFVIGREGVRLTLRALDGRSPKDGLTQAVCEYLNASDVRGLLARVYEDAAPNRRLAELAPMVVTFASDGHRAAAKIVQQAALDLAELARTVARHAGISEQAVPLVLAGGLLQENSLLTYLLETRITNELPLMHVTKNPPPPVMGALLLAERMVRA